TYLAAHEGVTAFDKYKAGKLIFLTDKYHLVRYGRPVLGGEYRALEYGPVPQEAMDILHGLIDESRSMPDDPSSEQLLKLMEIARTLPNPRFRAEAPAELACLSRSEIMALDHVILQHGRSTFQELLVVTHAMPAYRRPWSEKNRDAMIAVMRY